ncbi:MAG: hypothetical protein V7739_18740 [Motiliproteus sp.]
MLVFVDKILYRIMRLEISDENNYADLRGSVNNIDHILYDMDLIDSKSAALLTHVSIMLAVVVGMMYALIESQNSIFALFLKFKIIFYAIVALGLLRCVDILGPPFRKIDKKNVSPDLFYYKEIMLRRAVYQFTIRMVYILTFALVVVMTFKAIFFN